MVVQHLVVIHLVDMVTRQNKDIFRIHRIQEIQVRRNRICGTAVYLKVLRILLTRRQNIDTAIIGIKSPVMISCNIRIQQHRLILSQHADCIDVRVRAVAERKVDNPVLAAEMDSRLRDFLGQFMQAGSPSSCKNHGHHRVCSHSVIMPPEWY